MNKKVSILLFFAILLLIGGCKKYQEDSSSSRLRTVKHRLVCHWWFTDDAVNKITGVDYSGSQGNDNIIFYKNGDFTGEGAVLFGFNGHWKFEDDKNYLHIYNNFKSFTFKIIQLDASKMHLKNDSLDCYYH